LISATGLCTPFKLVAQGRSDYHRWPIFDDELVTKDRRIIDGSERSTVDTFGEVPCPIATRLDRHFLVK
jgi:hypothetical protein